MNEVPPRGFPTTLKIISIVFLCGFSFVLGRLWLEFDFRESERLATEQAQNDLLKFHLDNLQALEVLQQDLLDLDESFRAVPQKYDQDRIFANLKLSLDRILEQKARLEELIIRRQANTKLDFDPIVSSFLNNLTVRNRFQYQFTDAVPELLATSTGPPTSINRTYTKDKTSNRTSYTETIAGSNIIFSKFFPGFYAIQQQQPYQMEIVPGQATEHFDGYRDSDSEEEFSQEFYFKDSSGGYNFLTSLRVEVRYRKNSKQLEISVDYRGVPAGVH
ncbi:MAG: hypothetical protein R3C11_19955 [Planctomycetaceae bacterium]